MLDVVEELFQQGVELHKSGKVEVASQLYTAVLKAQPRASRRPTTIWVYWLLDVGKVQEALPFFEAALEANADTAQFWLSYIDALINVERIADAQAVLDQAKNNGAKGDGFDQLERRLNVPNQAPLETSNTALEGYQDQPNILETLKLDQALRLAKKKAKEGSLAEAKRIYQDVLVKFPKNKRAIDGVKALAGGPVGKAFKVQDPPQYQLQSLIDLYSQGLLQQALEQATVLLQKFPSSGVLYNIFGAAYKGLGQFDAAIEAYSKALAIEPENAQFYSNMGVALQDQGNLEEAMEAYNKALAIKPDYAEAYNNMGIALQEQGKLEEAIEAYNKALAIKPDYADAYNNMGVTLKDQGKLEEAIEAYNKALSIKPDYAEAYNNMGAALQDQGKLEEAIEAYNKALAIKPDYAEAWNNIVFPLQSIKSRVSSEEELVSYYPKDTGSNYYQIAKSNLNFKINLGGTDAEKSLSESLNALAKADYSVIKKPEHSKDPASSQMQLTDEVVALVHFGRSGTGLLHSLIDGHPEVSTLPSIYLSQYFDHSTWERIISGGLEQDGRSASWLCMTFSFDATSTVPVHSKSQ